MKPLQVVDLFAGAGGFGLGFKQAGYCVSISIEIDTWAAQTLAHNEPSMTVVQSDIRNINTKDQIIGLVESQPDVIIGGPPCQGFSISGPAKKDPKDPRNTLFMDFANWVSILRPRVFIMENVKGLLSRRSADGKPVIEIIKQTFEDLDYGVNVWLLNAASFGVPQVRERVFVVGSSQGDVILAPSPTHSINGDGRYTKQPALFSVADLKYAPSLWDVISDLPALEAGEGQEEQAYFLNPQSDLQRFLRGDSSFLYNHVAMNHTPRIVARYRRIKWGESQSDLTPEHGPRKRGNNGIVSEKAYDQNNRRLHPYKPSHTITASFYANFVHPFQHRNLTAREGSRIQTFPDSYRFMGKPTVVSRKLLRREGRADEIHLSQYNQIGNAVPPMLANRIAEHIKETCF